MSDNPNDTAISSAEMGLEEVPLSVDAMMDILASQQRRYLFQLLKESPENTVSLEEGYEHVMIQIAKRTGERPSPNELQISLHHRHIPILAESGIVQYDARSKTIRYHPNKRLEELFEQIWDFERNGTDSGD